MKHLSPTAGSEVRRNARRGNETELLDQCTLFDLHRASRVLTTLYNSHLRATGMTIAQFTLLRNIAAMSPAGVTQIADAMLMDRTSVTRLIEPLIKSGYLISEPGEEDRRVRYVSVTPDGVEALKRSHRAWQKAQKELFGIIGLDQWVSMRHALRDTVHLVRHWQDMLSERNPSELSA